MNPLPDPHIHRRPIPAAQRQSCPFQPWFALAYNCSYPSSYGLSAVAERETSGILRPLQDSIELRRLQNSFFIALRQVLEDATAKLQGIVEPNRAILLVGGRLSSL